jgi:hypothetical protein
VEAGTIREETASAALKHPLAVQILTVANECTISPSEFIDRFLRPAPLTEKDRRNALSKVSHHFLVMKDAGMLREVGLRKVRGAVEHFYAGTAPAYFSDDEWAEMSQELRSKISKTMYQGLAARVEDSMLARTFDRRDDRWLAWKVANLDDQGWTELRASLADSYEELERIRRDSEDRIEAAEEVSKHSECEPPEPILATFALLGFESPPMADPPVVGDLLGEG